MVTKIQNPLLQWQLRREKSIISYSISFQGNPCIPCPKRVLRTQWKSKAFIRGAYAYIPAGVDAVIMDKLAHPLSSTKNSTEVNALQ